MVMKRDERAWQLGSLVMVMKQDEHTTHMTTWGFSNGHEWDERAWQLGSLVMVMKWDERTWQLQSLVRS